jgi:endonuclease/exonuclease/phosphatase family metal-dependent hydrolase
VTGVNNEVAILEQGPEFHIARGATHIKVMSQNLYFGAPVEPIISAPDPISAAIAVDEAWDIMVATNFPVRAEAMAKEMAKAKPHLIGLQEVAIYRTEEVFNPNHDATQVFQDFLAILLDELENRNAHYDVAVELTTTDVEFPKFEGFDDVGDPILSGVRLTDRDVILVRSDVEWTDATSDLYGLWFGPSSPISIPIPVDVLRGWGAVTATIGGHDYRFVNTHLESEDQQGLHFIRTAQAEELANVLAEETLPLIVVGDFNSGPGRPVQPGEDPTAYDLLLYLGYRDLWVDGMSAKGENTCCHAGDLSNMWPTHDQRIDLVLYRNFDLGQPPLAWSKVVNDKRHDLRRYGTWFSDHAGVISWIVFPRSRMVVED